MPYAAAIILFCVYEANANSLLIHYTRQFTLSPSRITVFSEKHTLWLSLSLSNTHTHTHTHTPNLASTTSLCTLNLLFTELALASQTAVSSFKCIDELGFVCGSLFCAQTVVKETPDYFVHIQLHKRNRLAFQCEPVSHMVPEEPFSNLHWAMSFWLLYRWTQVEYCPAVSPAGS